METVMTNFASAAGECGLQEVVFNTHESASATNYPTSIVESNKTETAPKVISKYAHLEPMGSCWFCHKQVDSVRRFCSKTCSQDFENEIDAY